MSNEQRIGTFNFLAPTLNEQIHCYSNGTNQVNDYDISWSQENYDSCHVKFTLFTPSGSQDVTGFVPVSDSEKNFSLIAGWFGVSFLRATIQETNETFDSPVFQILDP